MDTQTPDSNFRKWQTHQIGLLGFFFILCFLISQVFYSIAAQILNTYDRTPQSSWLVILASILNQVLFGFILLGPYLYRTTKPEHRWSLLGFQPESHRRVFVALCSGLTLGGLFLGCTLLWPPKEPMPIERLLQTPNDIAWMAVLALVLAPLIEEGFFRGALWGFFKERWGRAPAVYLIGMLFGLLHIPQLGSYYLGMVMILGLGIFLTALRSWNVSTTLTWIFHLGYNAVWISHATWNTH